MVAKFVRRFIRNETGAAMVEYAIALLVAAGVGAAVFTTMGEQANINATDACEAMGASAADCAGTE